VVVGPPHLTLSLVRNLGEPWPTNGLNNLGFTITFASLSGCACATVSDLVLTFNSDTNYGNTELDMVQGMKNVGLAPSADLLQVYYWKQVNSVYPSAGIQTGKFSLVPGDYPVSRQLYAYVQSYDLNQLITSQAILSSDSLGYSLTVTADTYIYGLPPTPTPIPSPTATPVAGLGQVVAYPQPARDTVCFNSHPPSPGPLEIDVYNAAFERVARVTDPAPTPKGDGTLLTCVPIGQLPTGVYFYRTKVGAFSFPLSQFGVAR
jgi:hypothetical protein